MNNSTIYIVLDEIGALHTKNENYFGVGGYITNDYSLVQRKCQNIEKKLKKDNDYIKRMPEIKGWRLKPEHITQYISFINQETYKNNILFIPVHILVNKLEVKHLTLNENESYNFFVKWLLNYLIKCKIINNCNQILLLLDKRSISTKFKHSLQTHLNLFFYNYAITFQVQYKDSANNSYIRLADIICHCLFRMNNYISTLKTNKILFFLTQNKINLNKNKAIFPYKKKKEKIMQKIDLISKNDNM
ncbi:MAG: DUF3800 domain-containing protein [Spiroplasma sp.]|nr:DUF3800 domain-containing protein [Spiroplasma sp.]